MNLKNVNIIANYETFFRKACASLTQFLYITKFFIFIIFYLRNFFLHRTRTIGPYELKRLDLLKFVFNKQMLSLSFVIFTDVGEILAIDSIKAGLHSQEKLAYYNYWIKLVPNNVKNVETKSQNVETKSQTLTIVLVCLSIGAIIIVITIIFYLRRRKKR